MATESWYNYYMEWKYTSMQSPGKDFFGHDKQWGDKEMNYNMKAHRTEEIWKQG